MFINRSHRKAVRPGLAILVLCAFLISAMPRPALALTIENKSWIYAYWVALIPILLAKLAFDPMVSHGDFSGKGMDVDLTSLDVTFPVYSTDELTFGIFGGIGEGDMSWKRFGGTEMDGDFYRGGGYALFTPAPDTRLLFDLSYSYIDTDVQGFGGRGSFDTDLYTLHGDVTRRFDRGDYWLQPSVGFVYSHADRESFVDGFSFPTPSDDITLRRVYAGLGVGRPLSTGYQCDAGDSQCQPGILYLRVEGFYDDVDADAKDPTFPADAELDDDYFGASATVGAGIPVSKRATVGGALTGITAGDLDGYVANVYFLMRM